MSHSQTRIWHTREPSLNLCSLYIPFRVFSRTDCPSRRLARRYVVDERFLGTAYGLITAVQNAGLAGVPLLAGYIKDTTNNWSYGMFLIIAIDAILSFLKLKMHLILDYCFQRHLNLDVLLSTYINLTISTSSCIGRFVNFQYFSVELYFMGFAAFGAVIGIFLNIQDARTGNRLNMTYVHSHSIVISV